MGFTSNFPDMTSFKNIEDECQSKNADYDIEKAEE